MALSELLQDFDAPQLSPENPAPEIESAYEAGYAAGQAAMIAHSETERRRCSDKLLESLSDLAGLHEEIRREVLTSLRPLFSEVSGHLVPECLSALRPGLLLDALEHAAALDTAAPLVLRLMPEEASAIQDLLAGRDAPPVILRPDPEVPEGRAEISAGTEETEFDTNALLTQLREALRSLAEPDPEPKRRTPDD